MVPFNFVVAAIIVSLSVTTVSQGSEVYQIRNIRNLKYDDILTETTVANNDQVKFLHRPQNKWHLTPWLHQRTFLRNGVDEEIDCRNESSAENFPDGFLTDEQRRNGGFVLHILVGIYSFTLLALVCNDYFIPSVELICQTLKIERNIAAATFMAIATSFPEFFVNVISTFIADSDLGIGTIVGSAMFNCLGVAAVGGIAAIYPIAIDPGPLTRDCLIYAFNVSVLIGIVWDGRIYWYEAMILVILYIVYFVFMFNSPRLMAVTSRFINKRGIRCNRTDSKLEINQNAPEKNEAYSKDTEKEKKEKLKYNNKAVSIDDDGTEQNGSVKFGATNSAYEGDNLDPVLIENGTVNIAVEEPPKIRKSLWHYPKEKSVLRRVWWVYTWPLKVLLTLTAPSPKTYKKWFPLTFVMCIVWIGVNSYVVSWMMTMIGATFNIPDAIMGMTFLAFGGCLPEACSIYIMSRKGEGGMGVSNSLGANTLAILFSLGVPWFVKTLILYTNGKDGYITVQSGGIDYIIMSLLLAILVLWLVMKLGRFQLNKCTGYTIFVSYVIFITMATLMLSGVFFDVGTSSC